MSGEDEDSADNEAENTFTTTFGSCHMELSLISSVPVVMGNILKLLAMWVVVGVTGR